jgi:hypothetical protein
MVAQQQGGQGAMQPTSQLEQSLNSPQPSQAGAAGPAPGNAPQPIMAQQQPQMQQLMQQQQPGQQIPQQMQNTFYQVILS